MLSSGFGQKGDFASWSRTARGVTSLPSIAFVSTRLTKKIAINARFGSVCEGNLHSNHYLSAVCIGEAVTIPNRKLNVPYRLY